MKQSSNTNNVKTFPILFPVSIILVAVAVLLLCVASIVVSILQIISIGINGFIDVLKYPFMLAISVFCIVLVISILIKSQYVVDDTHFVSQFGLVKSKTEIKTITSIVLNTDTQKLTVYFGEEFTVLSFTKDYNEDFVRALLDVNPKISYSFVTPDSEEK